MTLPMNKKQFRRFLGLVTFYRKFIANMVDLSPPLSDMLKKGVNEPFQWAIETETCFKTFNFTYF